MLRSWLLACWNWVLAKNDECNFIVSQVWFCRNVAVCFAAQYDVVFVNFYAEWCKFSRMLTPIFDQTAAKMKADFPVSILCDLLFWSFSLMSLRVNFLSILYPLTLFWLQQANRIALARIDCDKEGNPMWLASCYFVSKKFHLQTNIGMCQRWRQHISVQLCLRMPLIAYHILAEFAVHMTNLSCWKLEHITPKNSAWICYDASTFAVLARMPRNSSHSPIKWCAFGVRPVLTCFVLPRVSHEIELDANVLSKFCKTRRSDVFSAPSGALPVC